MKVGKDYKNAVILFVKKIHTQVDDVTIESCYANDVIRSPVYAAIGRSSTTFAVKIPDI